MLDLATGASSLVPSPSLQSWSDIDKHTNYDFTQAADREGYEEWRLGLLLEVFYVHGRASDYRDWHHKEHHQLSNQMHENSDFVPKLVFGGVEWHIKEVESEGYLHHVEYSQGVHTDHKVTQFHSIQQDMLHPKNSEELSNGEQDDKLKVSCLKPVSAAGVVHDNITLFGCIFVSFRQASKFD